MCHIPTFDKHGLPTGEHVRLEDIAYVVPEEASYGIHRVHLVSSAGGRDVWVRDCDTQELDQK